MKEEYLSKAKEIFNKVADEMGITVVSIKSKNDPEMGEVLEVLIDKNFDITIDDIQLYTDKVNELLDLLDDSDVQGYTLDISSSGSEREIDFSLLDCFIDRWLDITLKSSGEKITCKLEEKTAQEIKVYYFIKGRKKTIRLKEEDISSIRMGYKA